MSHPFGDLVTQHLNRARGLSQNKLARGIDQDPAVISAMCNGRRLSGRQARERVLAIIAWFAERGVLERRAEADALLEAAGMARLRSASPAEARLLEALQPDAPPPGGAAGGQAERRALARGRRPWAAVAYAAAALLLLGALIGLGLLALRGARARSLLWQETFDPLDPGRWQGAFASAVWEDLPGAGAALRENHPAQSYGKAESAPIAVDVDDRPLLRVSVRAVEPGASYSVQILDKIDNHSRDVLKELTYPGEHTVDLGPAMGWQGSRVFTINLWVGGESRSVTFERISVEAR